MTWMLMDGELSAHSEIKSRCLAIDSSRAVGEDGRFCFNTSNIDSHEELLLPSSTGWKLAEDLPADWEDHQSHGGLANDVFVIFLTVP